MSESPGAPDGAGDAAAWREEMRSAWLYREIAATARDPRVAALFVALASAAETQAQDWAGGRTMPGYAPDLRTRVVALLVRRLGAPACRPVLAAMKVRGLSALGRATLVPASHAMPTGVAEIGARHRRLGGGTLRAAVFGVNDGLISNTCLIFGMAGTGADTATLLTTGLAGLLAGGLSMAAGEYVSMQAQREMFEAQIALERAELERYPEAEIEELALIYAARGLELDAARGFARELVRDPGHALDTLAREELGLDPDDLGSPWGAAFASFLAFAAGASLPVLPLLVFTGDPLVVSTACAAGGLFAVGASLSLFTGRNAVWSGLRMMLIGAGAGLATNLIGRLFGVAAGM